MGDSGRITACCCVLLLLVLLLLLLVLVRPGAGVTGCALLLPPLLLPLLLPSLSPGRRCCCWGATPAALAAAAAAKPVLLLVDWRAVRAARSAAAAASAGDIDPEALKSGSPTRNQRMVRAVARDATAWPMLMGRRSASARSSGDSVCKAVMETTTVRTVRSASQCSAVQNWQQIPPQHQAL